MAAALVGCGGGDEPTFVPAPPRSQDPPPAETVSADTAALTCADLGADSDERIETTERLATAVAVEFRGQIDLDENNVVKGLFAAALAACQDAEPSYAPVDDLREVAARAASSENPLSVIFGGEPDTDEPTAEPEFTPEADVDIKVSDACAAAPPGLAEQIAGAERLSVDDSGDMRLEIATITGTITSIRDAAIFVREFDAFAKTANDLAIERKFQATETSAATDELVTVARDRALEDAQALGATACIELLGG